MKAGLTFRWRLASPAPAVALFVALGAATASGQPSQAPPNALQGFSQNRDQPINITSVSLEVRDKEKMATFIDNVRLVQGDTVLECKRLIVYYDEEVTPVGNAKRAPKATSPTPAGQQQIRRMEAKGGVVVTQKDQTALGENGVYDMKTNTMTLTGKVMVSQGQNVVRGDRLWVDLTTNVSKVESSDGGPVNAIFLPAAREQMKPGGSSGGANTGGSTNASGPANAGRPQSGAADPNKPKQTPSRPLKLN